MLDKNKKLEMSRVIEKKVVILNRNSFGLNTVAFALVKVQYHNSELSKELVDSIKVMPEVVSFYRAAGEYDYIVKTIFSDINSYDVFLQ